MEAGGERAIDGFARTSLFLSVGKDMQSRAFWAERMAPHTYHALMNSGFRRSGKLVYQPMCRSCRQCLPIRVPLSTFQPNKSQRRCARRNTDLTLAIGSPTPTDEKWVLYRTYLKVWHGSEVEERGDFEAFLYQSPVDSLEFEYRDKGGKLLAVGICDVCTQSLSSVYYYFDPAEAGRALGTFGVLQELQFARTHQIPYYYLGYWVDQCQAMQYKQMYRPHEILHADGTWRANASPVSQKFNEII